MYDLLNTIFNLDSGIGILFFVLVYIVAVLLILPASWLSLIAGYLYGPYLGTFIVFCSAFIGASCSFLLSKRYFATRIKKMINKFSQLTLLEEVIKKGGLRLILLTRLSPLFPFSILNYFYGLNNISFRDFSISLFCILPGCYLYCSLGSLANNFNDIKSLKLDDNTLISIISILSTSLVIYFSARYANEIIKEKNKD